jgi:hypothetical protein
MRHELARRDSTMGETHPAAGEHLPPFIAGPGQTDILFVVMIAVLIGVVLMIGNFYLRLHALPERMAHRGQKVQMEIVAVLALISLFTHNHLFWIAALLLALVQLPDFSTPMASIAQSLEKLANRDERRHEEKLRREELRQEELRQEELKLAPEPVLAQGPEQSTKMEA